MLLLTLATLLSLLAIDVHRCATVLTAVRYRVEADIAQPLRLVQLSDLHGCTFGTENEPLVALVAEQEPDLILMTGDMLDKRDANADVVCALIEKLTEIAPVYYGYGNHEMDWISRTGTDLEPILTEAGATVLDTVWLDIAVNGQALRLGGFYGYYRYPGMFKTAEEVYASQTDFFNTFEDTDRYKLLLAHIPTPWLDWGNINNFPVDLVLTGHFHGGQIRLPLLGGIYAPYVGLFPKYTEGMFMGETATCILSTGLGSSPGIPRINNLPQVVVVDLG